MYKIYYILFIPDSYKYFWVEVDERSKWNEACEQEPANVDVEPV